MANLVVVVVVWQDIYDPGQTQQKNGDRGQTPSSPQPAALSRSDAGSNGAEPAPCFVIQTVTPILPRGARCMQHAKIM